MTYDPRLSGSVLQVGAVSTETLPKTNKSGITINKADPLRLDSTDGLQKVDASIESQCLAIVGLAKQSALNLSPTALVSSGRLQNITVTGNIGDVLYLSKTGGVTTSKPDVGVAGFLVGDFVVQLGVLVKNESNSSNMDVLINLKVIGQL